MFQYSYEQLVAGIEQRGNWSRMFFENNNEIILELGCGKGEYTVGLAQRYPDRNFIGIDIKGARIWRGLRDSNDEEIRNVAFIRSRINLIEYMFAKNEVSEIWITFPDPRPRQSDEQRRLTSPRFIERYKKVLKPGGIIHLKTDNIIFFEYTLDIIHENGFELLHCTYDVYGEEENNVLTEIQTYYENIWLKNGTKIKYLSFRLSAP